MRVYENMSVSDVWVTSVLSCTYTLCSGENKILNLSVDFASESDFASELRRHHHRIIDFYIILFRSWLKQSLEQGRETV